MKIPAQPITGQFQRVVETAKGFILNGNYYSDKKNAIQNYLTLPISNSDIKGISIKRTQGRTPATYNNMSSGQHWITDNIDPTITYVFVFGDTNITYGGQFLKLKEHDDGTCEVLYQKSTNVGLYGGEMLWQNNEYILFSAQTTHNNIALYYLDKNTLIHTAILGTAAFANGGHAKLLWEDPSYLYFLIRYVPAANQQQLQIWTYSKATKTLVINQSGADSIITDYIIPKRQATAVLQGFNIDDLVIKTGHSTYTIYAPFLYANATELKIRRIKLDFAKPKGSALNIDKNFSGSWCIADDVFTYSTPTSALPYINLAAQTYQKYTFFPIINNEYDADLDATVDKLYLGVGISEGEATTPSAASQGNHGVYIYRLKERTDYSGTTWSDSGLISGGADDGKGTAGVLELCGVFNILKTSDYVRDVFPITHDGKYIALRFSTRVQIVKLDPVNVVYTLVRDISANARIIGTDKFGYFYIVSSDDANTPIQRINLMDASTVYVELEKYSYNYTGAPVTSYAKVFARSLDNTPIKLTVDLIASANVEFEKSGGQRVTVEVEDTVNGTIVPFTINSAQTIEITPVSHI